jgi:ketosteroid isomerase-like protein
MKKYIMFSMVALSFIMLSACTSLAKNQQSPTLTSQLTEQPVILKEIIVAPPTEEPAPPEEDKVIQTKEPFVLKEVIVAPPTEKAEALIEVKESAASSDVIGAESAVTDENQIQESGYQNETDPITEENIRTLVNTWLTSWESGDFDAYRNCYASDFRSKGMNLDAWIDNKINVRNKSQNISISIGDMQISTEENTATAKFYLHYISSILDSSGIKTLELKRTRNGWKIYKEFMKP